MLVLLIQEPISISDGINGSANSYTIIYSDLASQRTCGEDTIPASACQNQVCKNLFNVTASSCTQDTNISVIVYATNMLGDGNNSKPMSQSKCMDIYYVWLIGMANRKCTICSVCGPCYMQFEANTRLRLSKFFAAFNC